VAAPGAINPEKAGLVYWMDRVLEEHAKLGDHLSADPVHDLRVALRRCILIADIMKDLDPGGDWKPMRRAGKRLFRQLGALRDTQVLTEWVERLGTPGEDSTVMLQEGLKARYDHGAEGRKVVQQEAMASLGDETGWPFPARGFRSACE
jgi:CHAD domain-containing protein